jgi:glycosyltransferase involved in cell wall biosynthesis
MGSLSREKRVDLAIDAVAKLANVSLLVVGDGPERTRLQTMAAAAGAPVRFLGPVERPQNVLAAADVVVMSSDTEGQPAVAIEAGLSGLPVVATRVGGLSEVVEDGETGLLVVPGHAAGLAAAIQSALAHRSEMGNAARTHCLARFDLDRIAVQWQQLIRSVAFSQYDRPLS